jgi:hypothetical protein
VAEVAPSAQSEQLTLPATFAYVPGVQLVQLAAVDAPAVLVPVAHATQLGDPGTGWLHPTAQPMQATALMVAE